MAPPSSTRFEHSPPSSRTTPGERSSSPHTEAVQAAEEFENFLPASDLTDAISGEETYRGRMATPLRFARKLNRACMTGLRYSPLVFVYGITTWAVYINWRVGMGGPKSRWIGPTTAWLGAIIYTLTLWSYTTAVFTSPGTTTTPASRSGYSSLPTHTSQWPKATSFTVKSDGSLRFCKKCVAPKPDRAHHCSSCGTCVLKMDHHCPWLATCVGLRNYKPFLLFLIYVTLLCVVCFLSSSIWVFNEVLDERNFEESSLPVHIIMLAVVSGVLGVVLAGFGGWHVSLACRGLTTIECLEKTRYLSPVRKAMKADWAAHHAHGEQGEMPGYSVEEGGERSFEGPSGRPNFAQQLRDIHANILPGVTRPEEGAESDAEAPQLVSAPSSLHGTTRQMTYHQMEQQRARDRYEAYLDEQDSAKLPNAFDHGWKSNLSHLFGPRPLLWALPICNTTGDGWAWEASEKWLEARERVSREREEQRRREAAAGWGHGGRQSQDLAAAAGRPTTRDDPEARYAAQKHYLTSGSATYPGADGGERRSPRSPGYQSKADRVLGRSPDHYSENQLSQGVSLQTLTPRSPQNGLEGLGLNDSDVDEYPSSEEEAETPKADKPILGRQWSGASGKFGSGGVPQVKLGQGQIPTPRREREDDEESVD